MKYNEMLFINQNHLALRWRFLRFLRSLTRGQILPKHLCHNSQLEPSCLRKLGTHRLLSFCWNPYYVTDGSKIHETPFLLFISKYLYIFLLIIFNDILLWFVPGVVVGSCQFKITLRRVISERRGCKE